MTAYERPFIAYLLWLVLPADVTDAFLTLADNLPEHDKMLELLSYFEETYIQGRWHPGHSEQCYGPVLFPKEGWNHIETAQEGLARTTNSMEGWHYGLQALIQGHHPTLWTYMKGIAKVMKIQRTAVPQGVSGSQSSAPKETRY